MKTDEFFRFFLLLAVFQHLFETLDRRYMNFQSYTCACMEFKIGHLCQLFIISRSFMSAVYYSPVIYAIGLLFSGHLCQRFTIPRSFMPVVYYSLVNYDGTFEVHVNFIITYRESYLAQGRHHCLIYCFVDSS